MYQSKSIDKITRRIQRVRINRKRNQTADGGSELGGGEGITARTGRKKENDKNRCS
jgi:hypothetical protein